MEGKVIKEEVVEGTKDTSGPQSPQQQEHKQRNRGMKSPDSPEGGATPPCPSGTPPAPFLPSPSTSPPAGRPTLTKLKRFLSTLVQFGGEISSELGDRIRTLIFSLVNGNVTIEEFHTGLQEMTNFPLRPFVLPFLRTHLPLLQREVSTQARSAKQTVSQFLRHHEQLVLDPSCSPSEASEIFHSDATAAVEGKRRHPDASIYENGVPAMKEDNGEPPTKRERVLPSATSQSMPLLFNPLAPLNSFHPSLSLSGYSGLLGPTLPLLGLPQGAPPPHLLSNAHELTTDRNKEDRSGDEEWKNINTMLNCILSMVEKTKRALSILQTRDRGIGSESDLKRAANEIIRITEDRIGEIKRRAEEAVHEVKRQAMIELERLVVKNSKAREELEDSIPETVANHQNLCWNCGRKAHETCSGCNVARYCGALCQHRDWENHHQLCCTLERRQREEHHFRRNSNSNVVDENHNKGNGEKDIDKRIDDKEKSRGLSTQLLSIDNIRRLKNQVEPRCLRTTPPVPSSSLLDK